MTMRRDAPLGGAPVRVAVFNDSATVRALLRATLRPLADFEIVLEAEDGRDAATLCETADVGLVLMDIVMPHVDGLRATRDIVAHTRIPVIVVSSVINVADPDELFSAMQAGAVFVMEPPSVSPSSTRSTSVFVQMLRNIARSESLPPVASEPPASPVRPVPAVVDGGDAGWTQRVVAVAASAGGPGATAQVLRAAHTARVRAAVLLVQHLAAGFSVSYATWLSRECGMSVAVAADGDLVREGHVYLAPTGSDLTFVRGRCRLTAGDEDNVFCPSADRLLASVASLGRHAAAVVLSGMGSDGARGAATVRAAGGRVAVQTPESCAVGSMPQNVIRAGHANAVLSTQELGQWIATL